MEGDIEKASLLREDIHVYGCECELCDDGFMEITIPKNKQSFKNKRDGNVSYFIDRRLFDKCIPNGNYELFYMGRKFKVKCYGGFIHPEYLNKVMSKIMEEFPTHSWIEDVTVLDGNKLRLELGS